VTTVGELTGDRIELNSEVPFPPFPLWLRVPAAWSQLDSNPSTWRRSAEDLIDTAWRGSRLPAKERRQVMSMLEGLVADCQRAGAALSLITVGRLPAGGAASFGIHLAFASDGRAAGIGRVHDILPRSGVVTEIATNSGPALLHRDRMTMVVPGTAQIAALTSIQIFVPIPGTSWTVVLSTASAYPELTNDLDMLLRATAESITTRAEDSETDESATSGSGEGVPPVEFEDAPTPRAAGFERGFGTMVVRRLGSPESVPRDAPTGASGNGLRSDTDPGNETAIEPEGRPSDRPSSER